MVAKLTHCTDCRKQIDMPGKCYSCATGRPRTIMANEPVRFASDWVKEGKSKRTKPTTTTVPRVVVVTIETAA